MEASKLRQANVLIGIYVAWLASNVGNASEVSAAALKLKAKNILADSALIFFYGKDVTMVSQWIIEYRDVDAKLTVAVNSTEDQFFVFRLSGLEASTDYQVRAKALKFRDGGDVSGASFSQWYSFRTEPLLIFGRVDFANVPYTVQHKAKYGAEWNATLQTIETAYTNVSHYGINVVEIANGGGILRVHYRVKIVDKNFPSKFNFTLLPSEFENSFINYDETPDGNPYAFKEDGKYTLMYIPEPDFSGTKECKKLVERYMIVTPQNDPELEIHLNVASSEATTADEEDSLRISAPGEKYNLLRDDGIPVASVSQNQVVSLSPKILVKDCLNGSSESLYTEFHRGLDVGLEGVINYNFLVATDATASVLLREGIAFTTIEGKFSFIVTVPNVDKAVKYQLLNGSSPLATLTQRQLVAADVWKFELQHQSGASYNVIPSVTLLRHDGTTHEVKGSAFSMTPDGSRCTNCSRFSSCTTNVVSGEESCACVDGYLGDGFVCEQPTTPEMDVTTTGEVVSTARPTTAMLAIVATAVNPTNEALSDPTTQSTPTTNVDLGEKVQSAAGKATTTMNHTTPMPATAWTTQNLTTVTSQSGPNQKPNMLPIILAVVLCCIVFLLLLLLMLICIRRRKRNGGYSPNPSGDMPQVKMQLKNENAAADEKAHGDTATML